MLTDGCGTAASTIGVPTLLFPTSPWPTSPSAKPPSSTCLTGAATAFAKAAGAVRLTLSTAVTNTHAQAVYESLGWRRDELFYVYNFALQG